MTFKAFATFAFGTLLAASQLPGQEIHAASGTFLYRQGDLTRAATRFKTALAADHDTSEARRRLDEIRALSAPWIAAGVTAIHDDQPLERIQGEIEAGAFITPLLSVAARARPTRADIGTAGNHDIVAAEVEVSHHAPAARLETRIAAGGVNHPAGDGSRMWTGRAQLRLKLPNHFAVEARGERAAYLLTVASIERPVMTETASLAASLDRPDGWLGEAAFRVDHFPDHNSVRSGYAWLLAPVLRAPQATAGIGYSGALQDARQTRFNGRYDPYYTPENIISHSAILSLSLIPTARTTIAIRSGWGFHATERAPRLVPSDTFPGTTSLVLERRTFTPWDGHVAFSGALSDAMTLTGSVGRMQTAFYAATSGGVRLSYKFLPAASR